MEDQHRGVALVILGIIAVIAIVGLVLLFTGAKQSAGALFTNTGVSPNINACDSPCTLFPSGSEYDTAMMENRLNSGNRKWIRVGTVTFNYISANTPGGYNTPVLDCWCPVTGNPQFAPTNEWAQIIPGMSTGAAKDAGRYPGTPVNQYMDTQYPGSVQQPGQPLSTYPLGTNTMK